MKKYFTIFIILSTFAVPASGQEIDIINQQKEECLKYELNKWDINTETCVCKNDDPDYKMQNGRCMLTTAALERMENADEAPDTSVELSTSTKEQMAKDCNTAGGKIIADKCECNDSEQIYDPETITCISKTANYDAALNILNTLNSALDKTMAKLDKPQG